MHGLLFLTCIFSESFAAIASFAFDVDHGFLLRICCVLTFVYSIYMGVLTRNDIVSNRTQNVFWISFALAASIMLSMFVMDLFHDNQHPEYRGMVLSFGSKALVAPFLALAWNKRNYLNEIVKWIIPFTLIFTFIMLDAIKQLGFNPYMQLGIGYQTLSYAAAFSIGLLFYYLNQVKNKLMRGVSFILICLNVFILLSGGGKGAFVLVCVLFVLNFYSLLKKKGVILFIGIGLLLSVANRYVVNLLSQLSGGERILALFLSNDVGEISSGREELYRRSIDLIYERIFLGGGPGSVLYDVGIYAHNIFLDIMIDWGFVGLFFSVGIFCVIIKKFFSIKNEPNIFFLFVIFLMHFVQLMFSGTFYASFGIWFSSIAILGFDKGCPRARNLL